LVLANDKKLLSQLVTGFLLFRNKKELHDPSIQQDSRNFVNESICYVRCPSFDYCYDILEDAIIEGICQKVKVFELREAPNAIRILCLDGGGTRGIIEAMILAELERRTQKKVLDYHSLQIINIFLKIYELFDLVCGTSTGGIIALATAIKHRRAKKCISLCKKLAITRSLPTATYRSRKLEERMNRFLVKEPVHYRDTPKVGKTQKNNFY
jgi:hypothetical protein